MRGVPPGPAPAPGAADAPDRRGGGAHERAEHAVLGVAAERGAAGAAAGTAAMPAAEDRVQPGQRGAQLHPGGGERDARGRQGGGRGIGGEPDGEGEGAAAVV